MPDTGDPANPIDPAFLKSFEDAQTPVYRVDLPGFGETAFWESAKEGPRESFVSNELSCERTFFVYPYESRLGFAQHMIGYTRPTTQAVDLYETDLNRGFSRQLPQPYFTPNALLDGKPFAYCTELLACEGLVPAKWIRQGTQFIPDPAEDDVLAGNNRPWKQFLLGKPRYMLAKMRFKFGRLPYPLLADSAMPKLPDTGDPDETTWKRFVRVAFVPAGKHITFPAGAYYWQNASAGKPADKREMCAQTVGRMLQSNDLSVTWFDVPYVPKAAVDLIGSVNYTETQPREFNGFKNETLLLLGSDIQPRSSIGGFRTFDITYRMRQFKGDGDQHHNYFFRFADQEITWDIPVTNFKFTDQNGNGAQRTRYVFERADFRKLFKSPCYTTLPM